LNPAIESLPQRVQKRAMSNLLTWWGAQWDTPVVRAVS
jgi:hypothetical protein